MATFGITPFGTADGPFGGPGLITVLGALATGSNTLLVAFDDIPEALDPIAATSGVNPTNYTLAAVDPTYSSATTTLVPPGTIVPTRFPSVYIAEQDEEFPQQVILYTDAKMEPGVAYDLQVSPRIVGEDCEDFAGEETFRFKAPGLSTSIAPELRWEERYRDFDFRGTLDSTKGYAFDPANDIALQNADRSLKKRIYRRIFSKDGDFTWLRSYGVGLRLKSLARAGLLQTLADDVRRQILLEPDVADAAVQTSVTRTANGAFIDIRAVVRRTDDRRVPIQITEPLAA